jgi:hypothetical protein
MWKKSISATLTAALVLGPAIAGCESLPGNSKEQGTVIGAAGGAAAGAAVTKHHVTGAIIGGLLGAGGGYLIGANVDKHKGDDAKSKTDAAEAAQKAKANPATAADAKNATTADLNNDGFVTLDEVVAMKDAGITDKEMIKRLQATQQYFQLTSEQQQYLRDHGVDEKVVTAMKDMSPTRDEARTASGTDVDMRTDPGR